MPRSIKNRWVRDPEQKRSRATLTRLLDAAEFMLQTHTFDELNVTDLVHKARSSIGAFYTRFSDKEALLDAMYDRHQRQAVATLDELMSPDRWKGKPLGVMVESLVRFTVEFHRQHRGLLRTLVLRGYAKPDPRYADPKQRARLSIARAGALMASRAREIAHLRPRLAGELAMIMVLGVLRERLLFPASTSNAIRIPNEQLIGELTRAFLSYLGPPPAATATHTTRARKGQT